MLNSDLYRRLQRHFGTVKIINENQVAIWKPVRKLNSHTLSFKSEGGEEYNCCCPFCNDTRFHLYVKYTYGQESEFPTFNQGRLCTRKVHCVKSMVHCFHGCMNDPEKREELYNILYGFPLAHDFRSVIVPVCELPPQEILPPGRLTRMSDLPESHPAIQYMVKARRFPVSLLDYYGVTYCCASQTNSMAIGRIVIPIWFQGKYVGWQARKVGDLSRGVKYYTAPGLKKSQLLYNYDLALQQDRVVICEGVTDVWRVGVSGVCLLGKSASETQIQLIKNGWKNKDIFLLLDPDAKPESVALFEKLHRECKNVFIVNLPDGIKDAGMMNVEELHQRIIEAKYART